MILFLCNFNLNQLINLSILHNSRLNKIYFILINIRKFDLCFEFKIILKFVINIYFLMNLQNTKKIF